MLDVYLRKYAWTAKLALLFAAAWIAAKTVNTTLGAVIRPTPRIDLAALPAPAARAALPPIEVERLYALIGQKAPAPTAPEPEAQGPAQARTCTDVRAPPSRSALRAQLVAAIVADRPRWSIASITDLSTRETRIYGIGDTILGAQLVSVERIRDERDVTGAGFKVAAIVCNNGSKEYIDFEAGDGGAVAAAPNIGVFAPVVAESGPANPGEGVRKVADNRYEIKRSLIENTLSNLNNIATQARIVPSFKNGVSNGFKLFSITPGSLYSSIGVENGDVIQKINGYEINSPDKALEVYQKLRESPHITLEIERNGQVIRKEYNVAGP
jgi:general secretion pathway protein C